ncbi:MAG: tetratricopeptide repeat protein [Myxococcales bacterium]|nr:tetratricopeptide repeat protein [Myxococcales bacterium]
MNLIETPRLLETELETQDALWTFDGEPNSSIPTKRHPVPARELATSIAPSPPQSSSLLQHFALAEAAAQTGNWERAGELFIEMVETYPTFGPGYVGLASAAFALGEVAAGAVALEQAIKIYPKNAGLHAQLGVAFAHTGHLEQAQSAFLRVLDIEPDNIDALVSLAQLCRATRNFTEAVDILDHANKLAPDNPFVIGAIGTTALDLGDRISCEASLRRLIAIAPEHAEAALLRERLQAA